MVKIVIVEKNGELITSTVNELSDIFKKCNFRKEDGFQLRATWNVSVELQTFTVQLYSKTEGKSQTINKYDFPSPVDNEIYYGRCALIQVIDDKMVDLEIETWMTIYDHLNSENSSINEIEEEIDEITAESELEEEPYDYKK